MNKILASIALGICCIHAEAKVRTLQVTIGASATPIIASGDISYKWIVFQNNAAHTFRVGDLNVSASRGIQLLAGGSYTQQPFSPPLSGSMAAWYVFGTAGDVVDIIYDDGSI